MFKFVVVVLIVYIKVTTPLILNSPHKLLKSFLFEHKLAKLIEESGSEKIKDHFQR